MTQIMVDPIASLLGSWSAEFTAGSILLRVAAAMLLSAVIGCERSSKRHSAGLRTFILVTLAGCIAMMLDTCVFTEMGSSSFMFCAAAVVGIAIISIHSMFYTSRNEIKGLTTAVALWASGLIGMAAGGGYYTIMLVGFLAVMVTLSWFPVFEVYLKNRSNHFEIHLELTKSIYLQDFVSTIRRLGLIIDEIETNQAYIGSGLSVYSIAITISSEELKKYKTHTEIIEALRSLDYIYHIEEMV